MSNVNSLGKDVKAYRGIQNGTILDVIDNTGAVKVMMIGQFTNQGRVYQRLPAAGVGEYIKVTVKRGYKLMHNVVKAIVVEQRGVGWGRVGKGWVGWAGLG